MLLRVRGTVQGVGFRPFVHQRRDPPWPARLGAERRRGRADPRRRARSPAVAALVRALRAEAPPAARVQGVEAVRAGTRHDEATAAFAIAPSGPGGLPAATALPPDLALCPDCRRELLDPRDRRHRYPFINCTQCGPRYSILERLPYDRPNTTMRAFRMCPACEAEYSIPRDRRFHAAAQRLPRVRAAHLAAHAVRRASSAGEAALSGAVRRPRRGGILAVKGIGGYHLMVDAANEAAVAELAPAQAPRREAVRRHVSRHGRGPPRGRGLGRRRKRSSTSPAAPIVLLRRRPDGGARRRRSPPANPWVGAFLPYSPLHLLLLAAFGAPGRRHERQPGRGAAVHRLRRGPLEAGRDRRRLPGPRPADRPSGGRLGRAVLPPAGPILPAPGPRATRPPPCGCRARSTGCWLCVGAQMKSTVAVASGDQLVLSPHIGDLDAAPDAGRLPRTATMLGEIHGSPFTRGRLRPAPRLRLHALRRGRRGLPCIAVQHHLAHVLACLLEHRRRPDGVLGVAWDGTGYGEDGTIWGGEFLLLAEGARTALRAPAPLPPPRRRGRDPRRAPRRRSGSPTRPADPGFVGARPPPRVHARAKPASSTPCSSAASTRPSTTSAGRLFDAVGALLGLGTRNQFRGADPPGARGGGLRPRRRRPRPALPAARRAAAGAGPRPSSTGSRSSPLSRRAGSPGSDPAELAAAVPPARSRDGIVAAARAAGAGTVALGGGCFQNALLLDLASAALETAGFEVLIPRELPPNDGAIAAGQALGALWNLTTVEAAHNHAMCLAVPGKLLDIQGDDPLERSGRVSFGGDHQGGEPRLRARGAARATTCSCTSASRSASSTREEAEETFRYLRAMGDLEGLEPEPAAPAAPP